MNPNLSRRRALQAALSVGGASLAALPSAAVAQSAARSTLTTAPAMTLTEKWDKLFPKSPKVDHQKVTFSNRYGITLAGDLYLPKARTAARGPAIVVGGPFGAVKEQVSGLYAQTLAERGFATLAFDGSYTGESGGQPRNIASPDINTEDFSAAVDFIGLLPQVDRERIGMIGVCGWGGMALNAAAVDKRIKAVVSSTMYDLSRVAARGYNDRMTLAERTKALEQLSRQRWADAEKGAPAYQPPYNVLKGGEAQFLVDYHDYYMTPRGYHPRAVNSGNAWTQTNPMSFMNAPQLTYIAEISPRPVLIIHGEKAHSRYMSETAYAAAAEPKELLIIPGASHVDLYDNLQKIPFDRINAFFKQHLV
ncbi:alpha/beta hydrolase [Ottowia sp. SB7-C50]|uniref:alpha/beta hydrolase n=1 Tax=Ottowia sp. SB7-C50 TaxID=3081231 RepID=UPI0029537C73|nr:alpha/beta hydrolase [Ottowia sp. SB7-C50]WOP15092.1 alpha/beta hydrolase [Ottowia sp. SB7-C50]